MLTDTGFRTFLLLLDDLPIQDLQTEQVSLFSAAAAAVERLEGSRRSEERCASIAFVAAP
jgi:hypothetical protein